MDKKELETVIETLILTATADMDKFIKKTKQQPDDPFKNPFEDLLEGLAKTIIPERPKASEPKAEEPKPATDMLELVDNGVVIGTISKDFILKQLLNKER